MADVGSNNGKGGPPSTSTPTNGASSDLPQAKPGLALGMYSNPIGVYGTSQYQPYHNVRLWRVGKGTEPQVMDSNQRWHRFNDFVTSVSTQHSIGNNAGQFSLGVLPIRFPYGANNTLTSWAEIIKPMDYVEITLSRRRPDASIIINKDTGELNDKAVRDIMSDLKTAADAPTVLLRGFVTNVRIVDTVDSSTGKPARRVMINGMNFGKLWLNYHMFLLQENQENADGKYRGIFTNSSKGGILTPAQFMGALYGSIFRPQLNLFVEASKIEQARNHGIYCDVPSDGRYARAITDMSMATSAPSLDSVMQNYLSKPFTEFFTYDEGWPSGKPITTWRWAPLLNRANELPLPNHIPTKPTVRELHASEIQEHDIGHSDTEALTYFFAPPSPGSLVQDASPKTLIHGYLNDGAYRIYGFRNYEPAFAWYNVTPTGDKAVATKLSDVSAAIALLTNWLASVYEHNPDNMEGQVSCAGRPDIHIGEYLEIPESGYRFYVEGVQHQYVVGQSFTSTITLTRGLPMKDIPGWVLPAGHQFSPNASKSQGDPNLGAGDPNGKDNIVPTTSNPNVKNTPGSPPNQTTTPAKGTGSGSTANH